MRTVVTRSGGASGGGEIRRGRKGELWREGKMEEGDVGVSTGREGGMGRSRRLGASMWRWHVHGSPPSFLGAREGRRQAPGVGLGHGGLVGPEACRFGLGFFFLFLLCFSFSVSCFALDKIAKHFF